MNGNLLLLVPTIFLVAYSQLTVKWRISIAGSAEASSLVSAAAFSRFIFDPWILSAYLAALLGSACWIYALTKLPLTIAFPIYLGTLFVIVVLSGHLLFGEPLGVTKLLGICLILIGLILASSQSAL